MKKWLFTLGVVMVAAGIFTSNTSQSWVTYHGGSDPMGAPVCSFYHDGPDPRGISMYSFYHDGPDPMGAPVQNTLST